MNAHCCDEKVTKTYAVKNKRGAISETECISDRTDGGNVFGGLCIGGCHIRDKQR
jgi:hypothetical protein